MRFDEALNTIIALKAKWCLSELNIKVVKFNWRIVKNDWKSGQD
jgi:hypothetical protein